MLPQQGVQEAVYVLDVGVVRAQAASASTDRMDHQHLAHITAASGAASSMHGVATAVAFERG